MPLAFPPLGYALETNKLETEAIDMSSLLNFHHYKKYCKIV